MRVMGCKADQALQAGGQVMDTSQVSVAPPAIQGALRQVLCLACMTWVLRLQVLNRLTFASTLSHLRRINSPIGREGKIAKPRQLHNSQVSPKQACAHTHLPALVRYLSQHLHHYFTTQAVHASLYATHGCFGMDVSWNQCGTTCSRNLAAAKCFANRRKTCWLKCPGFAVGYDLSG